MDTQKSGTEIMKHTNRKENVTVKCAPPVKQKLTGDAERLRMSLSEYCEGILSNHESSRQETERLKAEVTNWKSRSALLESKSNNSANNESRLQKEVEELRRKNGALETESNTKNSGELEELRKQNETMKWQLAIFHEERFLWLLGQFKGNTLTVKDAYGEKFQITVEEPQDLLKAISKTVNQ